jgi:competence protein ComEC
VVDTEGGKALLLISPSGQTMLVDAGFPGFNDRDAIRIEEAAKAAGVTRFDFLVVTHYDGDHVNNVPATVARIPAVTFVDHGKAVVTNAGTTKAVTAYDELVARAKHLVVKPGDKIPFAGVDVLVVTSAFEKMSKPAPGGGGANAFCAETQPMTWPKIDEDTSENAASVGLLYTFGKFRMLDLGDLTWNKEIALMCPNNPIGTVDLLMVPPRQQHLQFAGPGEGGQAARHDHEQRCPQDRSRRRGPDVEGVAGRGGQLPDALVRKRAQ